MAVAVVTYRRPHGLQRLLDSLALLDACAAPWTQIEPIVVDNDPDESAKDVVALAPTPTRYVVEPEPGISAARNRAIAEAIDAGAGWIAFIDDDETVTSNWLNELLAVAEGESADAVIGAVRYHHPEGTPGWFVGLGVFADQLVTDEDGFYFTTNNTLLRIDPSPIEPPLFDPRFGLTGGSDHHLGARLRQAGRTVAYAPASFADEIVLPERVGLRSAMQRLLRNGNVMVRVDLATAEYDGTPEAKVRARAGLEGLARIGLGVVRAARQSPDGAEGVARGLRTSVVGAGQILASVGATVEEYRRESEAP